MPWWAAILRIPFAVIAPVIIFVCAIGAYTVHSSMFDVVMMLVFGVAGYFLKKCNYPLAPLVLAIVLGEPFVQVFKPIVAWVTARLNTLIEAVKAALPDCFFYREATCSGGWATWARAWKASPRR